jgi:Holliday junction resolvase RusA-like endonuclease
MTNEKVLLFKRVRGLPPSANNIWRHNGKSTYKVAAARDWQENTSFALRELWGGLPPFDGIVGVNFRFETRKVMTFDVDNRIKAVQDCLQAAGIIVNDKQVFEVAASKVWSSSREDNTVIQVVDLSQEIILASPKERQKITRSADKQAKLLLSRPMGVGSEYDASPCCQQTIQVFREVKDNG